MKERNNYERFESEQSILDILETVFFFVELSHALDKFIALLLLTVALDLYIGGLWLRSWSFRSFALHWLSCFKFFTFSLMKSRFGGFSRKWRSRKLKRISDVIFSLWISAQISVCVFIIYYYRLIFESKHLFPMGTDLRQIIVSNFDFWKWARALDTYLALGIRRAMIASLKWAHENYDILSAAHG